MGFDIKNKMRALKFDKIEKDDSVIPVDPRIFKKFLLSNENKFIAFPNQAFSGEYSPIIEMLESFQFNTKKIVKLTFCQSCLDEKKFTLLNKSVQIKSIKNQIICSECALRLVLDETKRVGLISGERINPKLKGFFNHLILKFKNVKKVLGIFKAEFNPVLNREITLYDVAENPPINDKYLNYNVDNLFIPLDFKNILKKTRINTLLPIQAISIEKGLLLERVNQLIMAPTSAGKTLIGEIAGISRILEYKGTKMLYLVPIVALANLRTNEFKKKYKPLKLKIIKKVGESLLDKGDKRKEDNLDDISSADVIVATYEAIDYMLRSGNKGVFRNIGTIIVDEIQTLIDPERGFILDGLIGRLKVICKDAQFLFLTANVGEPELLAKNLDCKLIRYNKRPVPIERHLILCMSAFQKNKFISKLIRAAFREKSSHGYRGQTIVFSNTRKKCETIASYLQGKGINVRSYHSGLTNEERKIIEGEFLSQKIAGVVATAALAAGVDLPASQVIFESLAMGINWLSVAEFEQMVGRAGRLKKHELGLAYLLVEPGKIYSPKMKKIETEEVIAIALLNGKIKDFELPPDEDKSLTELQAFISMFNQGVKFEEIEKFHEYLINKDYDLDLLIKKLKSLKLIRVNESLFYKTTRLGQAIAKSFLTINQCLEIIEFIKNKEKNIIEIVLDLKPIRNVYVSKKVVADLSKNVNLKYFSNNLFSSSILSLMNAENIKKRKKFSREFTDFIVKWVSHIFNCSCRDKPFCDCGKLNLEKIILSLRTEEGFSVDQICDYLEEEYKILVFKGDIIGYLENLIYAYQSIKNIAESIVNLDLIYKREIQIIPEIIEKIKK